MKRLLILGLVLMGLVGCDFKVVEKVDYIEYKGEKYYPCEVISKMQIRVDTIIDTITENADTIWLTGCRVDTVVDTFIWITDTLYMPLWIYERYTH